MAGGNFSWPQRSQLGGVHVTTFPFRLVTVDVDGTLTRVHGWRFLAERLNKLEEYERTSRRFSDGAIGEDEHLANLMRIASGVPLKTVEAILEKTPRIRGIRGGLEALRGSGASTALLTHNPGYVCRWYQRRFGFDDFEGTPGQEVVDGIVGTPVGVRARKPEGLRRLCERQGVRPEEVAHIGDSLSDAAVFRLVGAGVALNAEFPQVDESADLALQVNDFRDLVERLKSVKPRTL